MIRKNNDAKDVAECGTMVFRQDFECPPPSIVWQWKDMKEVKNE